MSAVALNPSLGPPPSSPDATRDPGRQPSGAFSFSSILKGIDQPDAPSSANGSPVVVVASAQNAPASPVGSSAAPTGANDPFSIEAGLAALGYGPFDASQAAPGPMSARGSGASVPTQKAVAAPQVGAASSSPSNPAIAVPTAASSAASPASPDIASSSVAATSGPPSIEAELAALGYGPSEASQATTSPAAGSPGSPLQGASANVPTQTAVAAPTSQAGLSSLTNPRQAGPTPAPAGSSDASTGQNAAAGDPTATSDPLSIAAGLSVLGYGASEASPIALSGGVSQSLGVSGSTQSRAAVSQRQVAATWRTNSTTSALSASPASQGGDASGQTQSGGVASQGLPASSARTRPSLAALDAGASDLAQSAPASSLVSQGLISQGVVPQGALSQSAPASSLVSEGLIPQGLIPQAVLPQGAGGATQKAAAAPQNSIGASSPTDPQPLTLSGATDLGSPLVGAPTDAVSNATVANPLTADPLLGLQSLQSRTHLAMTNAVPVRTGSAVRRATAPTSAPVISSVSAPAISSASSATTAYAGDGEPAGEQAAAAPKSPVVADAGTPVPVSPAASLAVAGTQLDPSSSGFASIPLSGLAEFVADQASSLTLPSSPSASAPGAAAPQAVKELEISLDPANLGAVSVKMRLANGKLSVVIGVASSSTLAAIENERGAISARLGSAEQPLENLVIMSQQPSNESSQDSASTASGGNDASDSGNPRQARSNDNSSSARRGDGGLASGQNDPPSASGSTAPASGGGRGALLV